MQPIQNEQAQFIRHSMDCMAALMGSEKIAFYQVNEELQPFGFILHNVDECFHQTYVDGMCNNDPLNISRLQKYSHERKIFTLNTEEGFCQDNIIKPYRSYLYSFEILDVCEILFSYDSEIVAGMSVLYPESGVTHHVDNGILAARSYVEFNWRRFVCETDRYRSARLRSRFGLSPREVEVMDLICAGRTNSEIASMLAIGLATVKTHLIRIYQKLGVENRASVVALISRLQGQPFG